TSVHRGIVRGHSALSTRTEHSAPSTQHYLLRLAYYYVLRYNSVVMSKPPVESLASLGRFSEPAFNILVALADGPKHGYAMTQDIEAMTGNRPGPGTLYGAIARLEERRWIEPLPSDDRRRPYRLTSAGQKVLRARIDALRAVTKIAQT